MKNANLFPLERNSYFFGKLLTEREYNSEQDYFNNKRRLINSMVIGSGIVCGLMVVKIDGSTIAVESGLALDGFGRELAIPSLLVNRLSDLDGFFADRKAITHVYLCAEYAETPTEPVHAMTGSSDNVSNYSRIRENVKLYLNYSEPEAFETTTDESDISVLESLEKRLERKSRERLYLAKINLVSWDESYEIDSIEQAPFGQYVRLCSGGNFTIEQIQAYPPGNGTDDCAASSKTASLASMPHQDIDEKHSPCPISRGILELVVPHDAKAGTVIYSENIPHKLGLVPACVIAGYCEDDSQIFGSTGIFDDLPFIDYAVKVNNNDGTFCVGVRLNSLPQQQKLRFSWFAMTDSEHSFLETAAKITISPGAVRIKPRESTKLSAVTQGVLGSEIIWSVRESSGGDITRDGVYTAPSTPGVYTVIAEAGEIFGSSLIVVS